MFLSRLIVFFTLAYSLSARAAEINPVKLATGARFDLTASASVGTLSAGQVSRGQGSIARQNWLPEGQRQRGYSVNFSLNRLASAAWGSKRTSISAGVRRFREKLTE